MASKRDSATLIIACVARTLLFTIADSYRYIDTLKYFLRLLLLVENQNQESRILIVTEGGMLIRLSISLYVETSLRCLVSSSGIVCIDEFATSSNHREV